MFRNKKDTFSYSEMLRTVGVDKPADMLFVTDAYEEAVAASSAGKCVFFQNFLLSM